MEKEGKFNLKFIFAIISLLVLMSFFSFGVVITLNAPNDGNINTSIARNINFTFTPTWNATGEVIGNCTLYTNFSGTWQSAIEFNGSSLTEENNQTANITNGSLSWVNYTFTRDLSNFVWGIGCYNGTGESLVLNFSANRTLGIDVVAPAVVQTADIFTLFNTTSTTPTITFNITDGGNGTGVNIAGDGNNSLNVTIYDVATGTDVQLRRYNASNENLTCSPTGNGVQIFQCTLNIAAFSLSNGTKNITILVTDKAPSGLAYPNTGNHTNQSSFLFTVDQIAPILHYFNITNSSDYNASGTGDDINHTKGLGDSPGLSITQNKTIFAAANWTDNLTTPFHAALQFFNSSSGNWEIINTTKDVNQGVNISPRSTNVNGWANLSFVIPLGHNMFEGHNVSFRIVVNDTLGNINVSVETRNITIQVNDTTTPTLFASIDAQGRPANFTNISTTTPTIVWNVTENSQFRYIAIQIDTSTSQLCNQFRNFTIGGNPDVEANRNGTMTVSGTGGCTPLSNGTHRIRLTAEDTWGNSESYIHNFTISTVTPPTLNFVSTTLPNGKAAINQSNVTPYTAINFTSTTTALSQQIKNLTWTSSCNSTLQTFVNSCPSCTSFNQSIYPFNYTGCKNTEANQTVTVTVSDTAGNSNSSVFGFLVDDLGPSIALDSPSNGLTVNNELTSVNFSVRDIGQAVSTIGYFLDERNLTIINRSASIGAGAGANTSSGSSINITPVGTKRFKLTANDTLGNVGNGSIITFTIRGPIDTAPMNDSIASYLASVLYWPANASLKLKGAGGEYTTVSNTTDTGGTFEISLSLNQTSTLDQVNVTITELNGSAANWDKINFTVFINETRVEAGLENNFSMSLFQFVFFNGSINHFLNDSNSYFGTVLFPYILNVSNASKSTIQNVWYFPDENNLANRTNVSICTAAFTRTTLTPCWNYSSGGKTLVFVPHFSGVGVGNDTTAPTITINIPSSTTGNNTVSMLEFNITTSQDTASCKYAINATNVSGLPGNVTMTRTVKSTGVECIGQTEQFKTNNGKYNISFYATDESGNIATSIFHLNISDTTAPNNGVVTSSGTTTGATITVTGTNESVNLTVNFGTTNTSLSSSSTSGGTDFNVTQTVTISGLATVSTAITYHYNITVCDFNGNCKTNGTFTFSQTATAAASSSTTTSSGSSGGGGGAATTSNVAAETSKKWDTLAAGSSAVLTINNANIAITGVVIDVKNAVTNAEIKVASLIASPFTAAAETKIYQYLQLTKSNIADTDASKITINFKVPKSWLSTNAVAEGDIVLYRYSDSKWNALETAMTGSDADNILYSSVTPGFSTFAIGSKEAAPAAPPAPAETPAETPAAPAEEAAPAPVAETPAEGAMEKKGLSTTAIAWIVVAVIVVVAAVGYTMMKRKSE